MSTKSDIAREYRIKYPDMPTLSLARLIYKEKENNLVFSDVEDVRHKLRYIEGKVGEKNRKSVKNTETFKEEARPYNPYKLPETYQEKREAFRLPTACNNILLISDLHIPYHDIKAVTIALDYGKQSKVNTIFINGDLIDNHQVSRFEKDPRKRSVKQEFDAAKEFLRVLRKTFPKASIYWLKGNHCVRWEKFLSQKVHEIYDDPYFHLEERLRLNEEKVTLIDDKVLVKMGKLSVTHGHHVLKGIFAPVNSARGTYIRTKQSTLISHVHKVSEHTEMDMDGNMVTCWSTGCLAELKPEYSPLVSNYSLGFAHVIIDKNGDYTVINKRIYNGKIL